MPGIFDLFSSDDPMKQQGLLSAAAAILDASGPSLTPRSFGQVLARGIGGYEKGLAGAQTSRMNDLKLKDAESDLKNQEMLRERTRKINKALLQMGADGAQSQAMPMPAPQSASSLFKQAMPPSQMGGGDHLSAALSDGPSQGMSAPQVAGGMMQPKAAPMNLNEATAQRLMQEAQIYAKFGDFDSANKRYEAAIKLQPKYSTDFRVAVGDDGKQHNYVLADNGTWKDTGLAVKPQMEKLDLGGSTQFVDTNLVKPGQTFNKTMTFADRNAAARLAFDKEQASTNQDDVMDPLAIRMTAQQYLAGDTSALQNFGRGAQGAKNLNAVRLEIARQANDMGLNGADIAAKVAEFGGIKAGQRTAGTRSANIEIAANEAAQLAPLAIEASRNVARSGFLPFGKAQIMFNSQTNDPNLRQFAMANTALANAYGQVMSRGGVASVSDKEHAKELLSTAFDQSSYEAAVQQLQAEIRAAQKAPKEVRKDLSGEVSGRSGGHDSGGGSFSVTAPNGKTYTFPDQKSLNNFKLKAGIK